HPGKERRRLEDDDAVRPGVADFDVADPDVTRRWRLETRQHVEERRLAAATRPHQADDLLIGDLEIDLVECRDRGAPLTARAEGLGEIANGDLAHPAAAYFPCQCSVRRSMREMTSSRLTPISPMIRMPKNTSVIRKNVPASWMMKPSPSWAAMSSA